MKIIDIDIEIDIDTDPTPDIDIKFHLKEGVRKENVTYIRSKSNSTFLQMEGFCPTSFHFKWKFS